MAGILGGLGYGADGLPHITSHYGYYMSAWHMVLALSGQYVDVNEKIVTFDPKLEPPFRLPFFIPSVWGYIQSDIAPYNMSKPEELHVFYTLGLHFGELEIGHLAVGECKFDMTNEKVLNIGIGFAAKWHCLHH